MICNGADGCCKSNNLFSCSLVSHVISCCIGPKGCRWRVETCWDHHYRWARPGCFDAGLVARFVLDVRAPKKCSLTDVILEETMKFSSNRMLDTCRCHILPWKEHSSDASETNQLFFCCCLHAHHPRVAERQAMHLTVGDTAQLKRLGEILWEPPSKRISCKSQIFKRFLLSYYAPFSASWNHDLHSSARHNTLDCGDLWFRIPAIWWGGSILLDLLRRITCWCLGSCNSEWLKRVNLVLRWLFCRRCTRTKFNSGGF